VLERGKRKKRTANTRKANSEGTGKKRRDWPEEAGLVNSKKIKGGHEGRTGGREAGQERDIIHV